MTLSAIVTKLIEVGGSVHIDILLLRNGGTGTRAGLLKKRKNFIDGLLGVVNRGRF